MRLLVLLLGFLFSSLVSASPLVLQSDFGLKDSAVASMRGIAVQVDPNIKLHDLSHENTPYNIWEAAYRLKQVAPFWPSGTVFVSVVDPGVGTDRASVVLKTKTGQFFVTPDNGTLSLVAEELGIDSVRRIDETRNRRPGSDRSYTFHGRDVYAYVGARLASDAIAFEEVGPELPAEVIHLPYKQATLEKRALVGGVPYLDFRFGNVWTNISEELFLKVDPKFGDRFNVQIFNGKKRIFSGEVPYVNTFAAVSKGQPLIYLNSLMNVAIALDQSSFAEKHAISYGPEWSVRIEKIK